MTLNYIYNHTGKIEYVVIPFYIWNEVKNYADVIDSTVSKKKTDLFTPSEYRGIISHHNLDIEQELQNIRDQWEINI